MKSTVVLFGGTFNPPHMGHLHCIRSVIDRFSPTKFIMIPSFLRLSLKVYQKMWALALIVGGNVSATTQRFAVREEGRNK